MKNSKLRELLKKNLSCYPFNDKYSQEEFIKELLKIKNGSDTNKEKLIEDALLLNYLNRHYVDYYKFLKDKLFKTNLSYNDLIDLIFCAFNRNFLVLRKNRRPKKGRIFNQKDYYSHKIQMLDPEMNKVEASAATEGDIDCINSVLNYVKYYKDSKFPIDENIPAIDSIDCIKEIFFVSSLYTILKTEYDEAVWNKGDWHFNFNGEKPKIDFLYSDHELLIINKVGHLRMQICISSNYLSLQNSIRTESLFGLTIKSLLGVKIKEKRIKKVWVENGFIKYNLAKGEAKDQLIHELGNFAAFTTYYSFLSNIKLPNLNALELVDLLRLYSLLQNLIEGVLALSFDDSIQKIEDTKKFPIKIEKKDLIKYFIDRCYYQENQIISFLNLLIEKFENKINLWNQPIIEYNQTILYINYLPIVAPVIFNFIDFWIEKAGFSLDQRGILLETFIKKELIQILKEKKYEYFIPATKDFFDGKIKEEIDLIINLKNIIVVAEIKCIKFPFDPRDRHNGFRRLNKGVSQVKRKIAFLKSSIKYLEEQIGSYENKEFVPIVITNHTVFAGYKIDEVSIIDFYSFESFFRTGKKAEVFFNMEGANKIVNEKIYYKNEDEMNSIFKKYFENPIPIDELKSIHEIVQFQVTPSFANFGLTVTSAQIKDDFLAILNK